MARTEALTTAREQSTQTVETHADADAAAAAPSSNKDTTTPSAAPGKKPRSLYRHVAAYHSETRHSSLSRESDETISFLGFRNLMVLVLGKLRFYVYHMLFP
jgi:diacylglycerol O-acyltransferase-1